VSAARAQVRVFVAADGNAFMRDIAGWIVEAAAGAGRTASLVTDGSLPDASGCIDLVVAPHELFELSDRPAAELQRAAAASVCVCTEQPGTPWFQLSVDACSRGLMSLDINRAGVDALRRSRIRADHLQLGAVPSMTAAPAPDRDIDVVFMGSLDDRRGAALAKLAPRLHRRRTDIRLFRFDRPATAGSPGLLFGDAKYRFLASARVLVNLHRARPAASPGEQRPYFEWARMVETMANGCVVVTEPAADAEPLVAGTHFLESDVESMADAIDELLADDARREAIADAARAAVTGPLALAGAVDCALDAIERDVLPFVEEHVRTSRPERGVWRFGASHVPPPKRLGPFRPHRAMQERAKQLAMAENRALRRLDAAACLLEHGSHQHVERRTTAAYDAASPEVSVVVTLYNYADVVAETLDSIVASEDVAFEVVIVEDHATDDSRAVAIDHLDRHPAVPMVLLGKDANEGLAAARNTGFAHARGSKVMVLDADNAIYPLCLRRLADALDDDPEAGAAYSILEDFDEQRHVRSAFGWDVERLCAANYIDAQAMWHRAAWQQLGGYRDDDDHVFGWEDWDLWLRLAAAGGRAILVPQILGRYRVRRGSMIALTNLATDEAIEAMHRRYPGLPWPDLMRPADG
jgi:hypothetical protein